MEGRVEAALRLVARERAEYLLKGGEALQVGYACGAEVVHDAPDGRRYVCLRSHFPALRLAHRYVAKFRTHRGREGLVGRAEVARFVHQVLYGVVAHGDISG